MKEGRALAAAVDEGRALVFGGCWVVSYTCSSFLLVLQFLDSVSPVAGIFHSSLLSVFYCCCRGCVSNRVQPEALSEYR